jgi:hypothetical protein
LLSSFADDDTEVSSNKDDDDDDDESYSYSFPFCSQLERRRESTPALAFFSARFGAQESSSPKSFPGKKLRNRTERARQTHTFE